eukprot:TRINITY_DN8906_c0_g1_i1.p1 TRINITY_DN8906_c0_g1~~TRINITY_DN8906_c0_g1_i1.p1  ORF type:complete len:850 (+),score=173.01 TRINITY_DN8906_c0_g1_i1:114-2663(+)
MEDQVGPDGDAERLWSLHVLLLLCSVISTGGGAALAAVAPAATASFAAGLVSAVLAAICTALIITPQWLVARHVSMPLSELCAMAEAAAVSAPTAGGVRVQLEKVVRWPPPGPGVEELRPAYAAVGYLLKIISDPLASPSRRSSVFPRWSPREPSQGSGEPEPDPWASQSPRGRRFTSRYRPDRGSLSPLATRLASIMQQQQGGSDAPPPAEDAAPAPGAAQGQQRHSEIFNSMNTQPPQFSQLVSSYTGSAVPLSSTQSIVCDDAPPAPTRKQSTGCSSSATETSAEASAAEAVLGLCREAEAASNAVSLAGDSPPRRAPSHGRLSRSSGGSRNTSSSSSPTSPNRSKGLSFSGGAGIGGLAAVMAAKRVFMTGAVKGSKLTPGSSNGSFSGRKAPATLQLRRMTVELVAVARGFTDYAAAAGGGATCILHRKWLESASQAAKGANGVLERFVGDETHFNFGGVVHVPQPGSKAAKALLSLRKATMVLSQDDELDDVTPPQVALPTSYAGAAQGPALCGYLGFGCLRAPAVLGRVAVAARALASLAEQTGFDILTDRRVADEAQSTVTAVPVDIIRVGRWGKPQEICHLLGARGDTEASGEWLYLVSGGTAGEQYSTAWDCLRQGDVTGAVELLQGQHTSSGSHVARQVAARLQRYEEEVRRTTGKPSNDYCRCVELFSITPVPLLRPLDARDVPLKEGVVIACPVRGDDESAAPLPIPLRNRRQSMDRRRSSPPAPPLAVNSPGSRLLAAPLLPAAATDSPADSSTTPASAPGLHSKPSNLSIGGASSRGHPVQPPQPPPSHLSQRLPALPLRPQLPGSLSSAASAAASGVLGRARGPVAPSAVRGS